MMADWDTDDPGDQDIVSQFPANERAARSAVKSVFAVDHRDTDDADQGKHAQVTLLNRATSPSAAAGQAFLFVQDVSGVSEAFWKDSAGNEYQLTDGGALRSQQLAALAADPSTVSGRGQLYTKTTDGQEELFWKDDQGNATRLTSAGELALNLQETDVVANSIRTQSFSRGHVATVSIQAGAAPSGNDLATIDWSQATVFQVFPDADTDLDFINMPDNTVDEEQTIYVDVQMTGSNTITIISDYTIIYPAGGPERGPTADGRDLYLATSDDGANVMVVPMLDMKANP